MTLLGLTLDRILLVLLLLSSSIADCAVALECSDGENCVSHVQNEPYIQEITAKVAEKPLALSMIQEDHSDVVFQPTVLPLQSSNSTDESKGRSLNFSSENDLLITNNKHTNANNNNNHSTFDKYGDLSDVNMDEDGDDDIGDNEQVNFAKILTSKHSEIGNLTMGRCEKGGLTYENGERLESGCDSICTCKSGKMDCIERCAAPYFRKGKQLDDPLCKEKDVDDDKCCAILVCAADTETEPLELCMYKNRTYNRGQQIVEGCEEVCLCEAAGKVNCKSRCPPANKTSDRCVEIPDPKDSCCSKVLCDVSLNDEKDSDEGRTKLLAANYLNKTTIELHFDRGQQPDATSAEKNAIDNVEISKDKVKWIAYKLSKGDRLTGVDNDYKFAMVPDTDEIIEISNSNSNGDNDKKKKTDPKKAVDGNYNGSVCSYKGVARKLYEEFHDDCSAFCRCQETGVKCLKIECPTYFGVDILDPHCIQWDTYPANFTPTAPHCCPEKLVCKNNGSCEYAGKTYQNWQQIPENVTGCEKRCFCEMGNIECQNICPPVPALPPPDLACAQHDATLGHLDEDRCCLYWMCTEASIHPGHVAQLFPGGFPNYPGFHQQQQEDINVQLLEAIDAHTVRLSFTIPPIIVGLHGRVEVRYTNTLNDDTNTWQQQIFAPPNDLISTQQLEFDLVGLEANSEYKIKISIAMRDFNHMPASRVYTIRTPRETATTANLPSSLPIEPELSVNDINATWVNVAWRKFTDKELQFIDGVQLRFKEIDGKIYAATPLIHRAVTSYLLENLRANTKYEIGIFFIPFPGQQTELHAERMIQFTTANVVDTYAFNVFLEIGHVKATSVEIQWSGVPYPEDKYVNIYRAIYQSDSGKGDYNTFKVAKRDSPSKTVILDLKPGTRYRLWLEVYLTNGKIKKSNVQDFITKPRTLPSLGASTKQDKLSLEYPEERGDYYGSLVVVAILAAVAILCTIVLLLILIRRHSQNKAAITPPTRVSQSAYDNPTYKVEIQQETMNL